MVFQDPFASLNPRTASGGSSASRCACTTSCAGREVDARVARAARRSSGFPRDAATQVPARVLGRPAPADRRRPRARASTRTSSSPTSRCRRSTSRSRRRSSTCSRRCRAIRADVPLHRPRPRGRPPHLRPDRGDVPRRDRRALAGRRRSTSGRCTRTRSRCSRRCRSPTRWSSEQRKAILLAGRPAEPGEPACGCRFHTRCPFVQPTKCRRRAAAAARAPPGPRGRVPLGRGDPGRRAQAARAHAGVRPGARPGRTRADARLARLSRRRRRRAPRASARGTRGTVRRPSGCRSRAGEAPAA